MTAYYEKELADQPLYLLGKAYRFELMETSDAQLIGLLDACAAQHKGGIIKLTQDEYVKKKAAKASAVSSPKRWQREEVKQKQMPSQPRFVNRSRNVNVVAKDKPVQTIAQAVDNITSYVPVPVKGILVSLALTLFLSGCSTCDRFLCFRNAPSEWVEPTEAELEDMSDAVMKIRHPDWYTNQ